MKKITAGTWIENPVMGQRSLLIKLPSETGAAILKWNIAASLLRERTPSLYITTQLILNALKLSVGTRATF
jgi:hypothetical protein